MDEKKKWKVGCLVLGLLFLFGIVLVVIIGLVSRSAMGTASPAMFSGDQIAIVRIDDIIYSSEKIVDRLYELNDEEAVKAIVLRINSPGGGVAASQEIFEAVNKEFNANRLFITTKIHRHQGSSQQPPGKRVA